MTRTTRHPLFLLIVAALMGAMLLASNSASAVLAAPTAATAPTNLGPFTAPNLPLAHDQANGTTDVEFDLSGLAQYSAFSLNRLRLNFEWHAVGDSHSSETRISLTSPDGTVVSIPGPIDDGAQLGTGQFNVEFPHFHGEAFAGIWTVSLSNEIDNSGDDFIVDDLTLTLLGEEITVANSGLIGWWPMDGTDPGVLLQDHSGHNNDAYPDAANGPAVSKFSPLYNKLSAGSGSYDFDGDDYFSVPNSYGQLDSGEMTVAAWVRYEGSSPTDHGGLFSMRDSSIRFTISRTNDGGIGFFNGISGASTPAGALPASTWVHLAIVFGETDTVVYTDGTELATLTGFTLNGSSTGNNFYIGRNHNPKLDGKMADVQLYNTALSSTIIKGLGQVDWRERSLSSYQPGRNGHAAVASGDDSLILIGGEDNSTDLHSGIATVKKIILIAGFGSSSAEDLADMNQARVRPEALRLPDGRIFVVGGSNNFDPDLSSVDNIELYDEETDTWTLGPAYEASGGRATLLQDGRVLLTGGHQNPSDVYIFDPVTDSLTATASLITGRSFHTATLLESGKVLVAGGAYVNASGFYTYVTTGEVWDPATGTWTATANGSTQRRFHSANRTVVNGVAAVALIGGTQPLSATHGIDMYSEATNSFTVKQAGNSAFDVDEHRTVTLPDNTLLIIGGYDYQSGVFGSRNTVLRYQPDANNVQATVPDLANGRYAHTATLLGDGRLAVFGSTDSVNMHSAEILFQAAGESLFIRHLFGAGFSHNFLHNFRLGHVQPGCNGDGFNCDVRPDDMLPTAATPTEFEDYTTYEDGEFYWQFCADYGDSVFDDQNPTDGVEGLSTLGTCPAWDDLTPAQQNLRFTGDFDSYTFSGNANSITTVRNDIFDAMLGMGDLGFGTFGASASAAETGQLFANNLIVDLATIHMLFGNEFLTQANLLPSQYSSDPTSLDDDDIIEREIEYLSRAMHQYMLAAQSVIDTANIRMGGVEERYLIEWMDADTLRALTYASEQQVTALEELIRRELARGVETDDALLDRVAQAVATQNAQALLIAERFGELVPDDAGTGNDESAEAFTAAGGDTLINNIGRLSQLSELIRSGFNPLGYDAEFVPLKSPEALINFVCGGINNCAAPSTGLLKAARDAETAYANSALQFDQNQADLGDALFDLHQEAESALTDLCGASGGANGPSWNQCDSGLMEQNRLDFLAANQSAALAWKRAEQISDLIEIEEELATITIEAIDGGAKDLAAFELAKGKLEAYRTTSTDFSTTSETQSASVEASVTASVKASVSAFPPGGNVEASVEVAVSATAGMSWESTKGSTAETTVDINAEKIGKFNSMAEIRQAEQEADIVGAESAAEVKRLLLEQSTLLLEYELSLVDINKVMAEHNHLVDQYQLLIDQLAASEADVYDSYANDPYFRIVRDRKRQQYDEALRIATHYAYLSAKSLEYLTLQPIGYMNELYKVRTTYGLEQFMTQVSADYLVASGNSNFQRKRYKISVARNLFGWSDEVIDPNNLLTPEQIDTARAARFHQYLDLHKYTNPQGNVEVVIDFSTLLDLPIATNYFGTTLANQRLTGSDNSDFGCTVGDPCFGLWTNFVTTQAPTDFDTHGLPTMSLTHGGHASYMRQNREFASYRPGPAVIIDYDRTPIGFDPGGTRTASLTANLNMTANVDAQDPSNLTGVFKDLSIATSKWRLVIPLETLSNQALDLTRLDDIEIRMDAAGFTANAPRAVVAAEDARLAAVQAGEEVEAETLAIVEEWVTEQETAAEARGAETTGRAITATPSFTLTNETYTGRMFTLEPIALDSTSAGFELFFNSDNSITGTLCAYCSAGYENDVAVTGSWESASITPTFSIETALFADVNGVLRTVSLNGEMQTRSRDLTVPDAPFVYAPFSGDPVDGVQFLFGTFSETVSGIGARSITRSGDFILTPPTPDFVDSSAVPTAVSLASATALPTGVALVPLLLVVTLTLLALPKRRRKQ